MRMHANKLIESNFWGFGCTRTHMPVQCKILAYFVIHKSEMEHAACCQQPVRTNDGLKYTAAVCISAVLVYRIRCPKCRPFACRAYTSVYTYRPVCKYSYSHVQLLLYIFHPAIVDRVLAIDTIYHLWFVSTKIYQDFTMYKQTHPCARAFT